MTQERLEKILTLISSAPDVRELVGLRWGLQQQGELTVDVMNALDSKRKAMAWEWPK